jgi:hypothetical protein
VPPPLPPLASSSTTRGATAASRAFLERRLALGQSPPAPEPATPESPLRQALRTFCQDWLRCQVCKEYKDNLAV